MNHETSSNECIFCKIIKGEIPSEIIYRDERVIGFKDINPQAPVHILIVPKEHIPTLNDLEDPELGGHILQVAKKIAKELGIDQTGYRVINNCNREAGQVIFHIHFHLLGGRRLGRLG